MRNAHSVRKTPKRPTNAFLETSDDHLRGLLLSDDDARLRSW